MRRAKPIAPKRVHLQPGFAYDFVLVGAGHMMAGLCVFLKLRQPGARVLVVDRAVAPGGCWLEANSFAYWLSPVPTYSSIHHVYFHDVTKLPVRGSGLRLRDDILAELEDLYGWTGVDLAFQTEFVGEAGGRLSLVQQGVAVEGTATHLINPRYRALNSFNDLSTRHDQMTRVPWRGLAGVRILGNSTQAGEVINYVHRHHASVPIEVYYRTAHPILTPVFYARFLPPLNKCWKAGDVMGARRILAKYVATYSKPLRRYLREGMVPLETHLPAKLIVLFHLSRRVVSRLRFIRADTGVSLGSLEADGQAVFDARNVVAAESWSRPFDPFEPSLVLSGFHDRSYAIDWTLTELNVVNNGFLYGVCMAARGWDRAAKFSAEQIEAFEYTMYAWMALGQRQLAPTRKLRTGLSWMPGPWDLLPLFKLLVLKRLK